MRKRQRSCSTPSRETVAELKEIRVAFIRLLDNTGVDAQEMRGDLGKILDIYFDLCCLIGRLSIKTDPHLGKLYLSSENKEKDSL